ncbi:hypothetical protein Agub_g7371, partial [Astrephomene gubernaculifera]
MVRLASFAARNAAAKAQADGVDADSGVPQGQQPGETPEAQEAALVAMYQSALVSAAEGRTRDAVEGLQAVLSHPMLALEPGSAASTRGTLRELRFLTLRNLADQLGQLEEQQAQEGGQQQGDGWGWGGGEDSTTAVRLHLYGEAVLQQHADSQ